MIELKNEEYFNQRIDCDVVDCKYHHSIENHCTLGKILISGSKKKDKTYCENFEQKIS